MKKQYILVADGDHVIVKHPGIDGFGMLLCEYATRRRQRVQARDCRRCGQRLARRIAAGGGRRRVESIASVDKELDTRISVVAAKPGVIRGAFVAELGRRGQGGVMLKVRAVGEDGAQHARGSRGFERAMKRARQIGRREMDAPIVRVGGRRYRRRVGRPHRRRR